MLLGIILPAGLIAGVIIYITVAAIWNERRGLPMHLGQRELIVMTILATVIAHFIEIHFGIAIVSTRTYFWLWSAVLVVLGMNWLRLDAARSRPRRSNARPRRSPAKAPQATGKGKRRPAVAASPAHC